MCPSPPWQDATDLGVRLIIPEHARSSFECKKTHYSRIFPKVVRILDDFHVFFVNVCLPTSIDAAFVHGEWMQKAGCVSPMIRGSDCNFFTA